MYQVWNNVKAILEEKCKLLDSDSGMKSYTAQFWLQNLIEREPEFSGLYRSFEYS